MSGKDLYSMNNFVTNKSKLPITPYKDIIIHTFKVIYLEIKSILMYDDFLGVSTCVISFSMKCTCIMTTNFPVCVVDHR